MGINEKMTSIAEGLRTLSSTSGPMGLDAMSEKIATANTTINEQSDLITQIKKALKDKGTTEGGTSKPVKEEQEVIFPTITENGNYEILPDDGKVMSKAIVNVEVPERYEEGYNEGYSKGFADNEPVLESLNVTVNGEYIPPQNVDGFNSVIVNVPPEVADSVLLESGTCGDNVAWELYDNGLLYLYGEGATYDYTFSTKPFGAYDLSGIKRIIVENGITTVGDYLFSYCIYTTNIIIPDSVTSIGKQAFYQCNNLTSITIGSGLTTIKYYAFSGCKALTSIFYHGTKSEWDSISFGDDVLTEIDNVTLHCEYEEGPTEGGSGDNRANQQLKAMIDGTLTELTDKDFKGVDSITPYAFYGQSSLETVIIPDNVTNIGADAFDNCKAIKHLTMPIDINIDVGINPFSSCSNITDIVLTQGNGTIVDYNYTNVKRTPWYVSRNTLTHITLPEGITKIGSHIFRECSALTGIVIPKSVTTIGTYAFYKCTGFKNGTGIYIPKSVTSIEANAFYDIFTSESPTYYEGNIDEWNLINIEGTGNVGLNDDHIHYNTPM